MTILSFILILVLSTVGNGVPQTNLLNKGCSLYKSTNVTSFVMNLDESIEDVRGELNGSVRFGTGGRGRSGDPVYVMGMCRVEGNDCLKCFDVAAKEVKSCGGVNGGRVVYDGCYLRYESNNFFVQTTLLGNIGICGNRTISQQGAVFNEAVDKLLRDIVVATPRVNGFFTVVKREVVSGGKTVVYALGQCAETVTKDGCKECLTVAYENIKNCPPGADGRAVDAGCFLRYSDTMFFNNNQITDITPFLRKGNSGRNRAIIGGVCGGTVLILLLLVFMYLRVLRKTKNGCKGDILGATELRGPVNFEFKELKTATKNFSEENKLGEGGFGDVYKGVMVNGKIVAVKKLAITQSSRAKTDYETEVKLISNVHHRNIIRLLGCCSKSQELLLVYEYMANSSLDKFLFGDNRGSLSWKQRLDVIIGTARGLAYLHEDFHVCIIHRDIKTSNILLDNEFQPKIADFGLSRLLPEDQTHLSTKFAGTLGYMAPEYAIHGQLSKKVDTYAFGMVVLEIISGRKSTYIIEPGTEYLLEWAWKLYEDNMLLDLVEESLAANETEIMRVIAIALSCTQSSVALRPTMSEIVVLLLSNGSLMDRPIRPTFIDSTKRTHADTSTSSSSSLSTAALSITQTSGR